MQQYQPEWRTLRTTRYPFSDGATLNNGKQFIPFDVMADAALYPVGGAARMYLASVGVTHDAVTLTVGTSADKALCSTTYPSIGAPDSAQLVDAVGRPAGLVVGGENGRLGVFAAWGVGTFAFSPDQTEFAATVCFPQPQAGVRGVMLPDGSVLSGDVWLVGEDGVVLRRESVTTPRPDGGPGGAVAHEVIRLDVVGDPLFRRRLCIPQSLFQTPRFLTAIIFKDGRQRVRVSPGDRGDVKLTVNNDLAADTVLRIRQTPDANVIEAVGAGLRT